MRLALQTSARRREPADWRLPEAWCVEIGRRLLLAELEFSEWVMRRVEKVTLERDRSVFRDIAGAAIRDDAPVFHSASGGRLRLVPLSMMRRRTLVNLKIRDEHGQTMTMPGLRRRSSWTKQSFLRRPPPSTKLQHRTGMSATLRNAIGTHEEVTSAFKEFDRAVAGKADHFPDGLCRNPLFSAMVNRFGTVSRCTRSSRTAACSAHRLVRMSFDEPTAWLYQDAHLDS